MNHPPWFDAAPAVVFFRLCRLAVYRTHRGTINEATLLKGKSTRPDVYKCRPCQKRFSVTVETVFEDNHVPLHKWVYASHVLTASKKGISSHQLMRMLGVSSKTAWFMSHRIRKAMRPASLTPMGGEAKVIEIDETYIGKIEGTGKKQKGPAFRKTVG